MSFMRKLTVLLIILSILKILWVYFPNSGIGYKVKWSEMPNPWIGIPSTMMFDFALPNIFECLT